MKISTLISVAVVNSLLYHIMGEVFLSKSVFIQPNPLPWGG